MRIELVSELDHEAMDFMAHYFPGQRVNRVCVCSMDVQTDGVYRVYLGVEGDAGNCNDEMFDAFDEWAEANECAVKLTESFPYLVHYER
jgi:hypothetical protein